MARPYSDDTGKTFGNLRVLSRLPTDRGKKYSCVCDACGTISEKWSTHLTADTRCKHCDKPAKSFYLLDTVTQDLYKVIAASDVIAVKSVPVGTYRVYVDFDGGTKLFHLAHRQQYLNSLIQGTASSPNPPAGTVVAPQP